MPEIFIKVNYFLLHGNVFQVGTYHLCYRSNVSGMFQTKNYWGIFYYSFPVNPDSIFVTLQGLMREKKFIQVA